MTDSNNNAPTTIDEYTLLKLLLEQLDKNSKDQTSSVNTVTTLWIILFGLVVLQKVFKYIIRPTYKSRRKKIRDSTTTSNTNSSESV